MPKFAVVFLHHAPMTLRVDEMVAGEMGIKVARQKYAIELATGRNEIDAGQWAEWLEQNKTGSLVAGGIVAVEEDQNHDH
jgi:hypothetical protein